MGFDVLARVRNPLAHNKMNILKDYERNKAISYCQEIVNRIEAWEQSRISGFRIVDCGLRIAEWEMSIVGKYID